MTKMSNAAVGKETTGSAETLYRSVILEHSAKPHHYRILPKYTASAHVHNMLCGDEITVYCDIQQGHINAVSFQGEGCAIMKASASIMTDCITGLSLEDAQNLALLVSDFLQGNDSALDVDSPFAVFAEVRRHASRVKCAFLPFQALQIALTSSS